MSLTVAGVIAVTGGFQLALMMASYLGLDTATSLLGVYSQAPTGLDPLLLRGHWWTPWTSQLIHSGPAHLLPNLAVVGYCGYRVERAFGRGGYAVVASSALLLGTLAVCLGEKGMVGGSSILGFGLFSAMLTIGFRFGEAIPRGYRTPYGYGNVVFLFVLLFGIHGCRKCFPHRTSGRPVGRHPRCGVVKGESLFPRLQMESQRRRRSGQAGALFAAPVLLGLIGPLIPGVFLGPAGVVDVPEAGVRLDVPWRLASNESRLGGMPAWRVSQYSEEAVFCNLTRQFHGTAPDDATLMGLRTRGREAKAHVLEAPPSRGMGWTAHALELEEDTHAGLIRYRVVEHDLLRGNWVIRLGYRVELDEDGHSKVIEPIFQNVVESARVGEPPTLVKAREDLRAAPADGEGVRSRRGETRTALHSRLPPCRRSAG